MCYGEHLRLNIAIHSVRLLDLDLDSDLFHLTGHFH